MFVLPSGSLNLFQTYYQVNLLDSELSYSKVSVEIRGPDNKTYLDKRLNNNGRGSFVPSKIGMHELVVKYEGHEVLAGDVHFWYWKLCFELVCAGHYFRVLPPLVEVAPPGMAPCALGSLVQVLVNATGAPKQEDILVTAYSPTGRPLNCPLTTVDGTNSATFKPDEPGEWRIEITYQGKQIQVSFFLTSSVVVFELRTYTGWSFYLLRFRPQRGQSVRVGRGLASDTAQYRFGL